MIEINDRLPRRIKIPLAQPLQSAFCIWRPWMVRSIAVPPCRLANRGTAADGLVAAATPFPAQRQGKEPVTILNPRYAWVKNTLRLARFYARQSARLLWKIRTSASVWRRPPRARFLHRVHIFPLWGSALRAQNDGCASGVFYCGRTPRHAGTRSSARRATRGNGRSAVFCKIGRTPRMIDDKAIMAAVFVRCPR